MCSFSAFAQPANRSKTMGTTVEPVHADITIGGAATMIKNNKNAIYLDVRTPEEIKTGKVLNALEMDIKSPTFSAQLDKLDKNKTYIVYCHVGGRSETAAKMMKTKGFVQVYNMNGGWKEYSAKNATK